MMAARHFSRRLLILTLSTLGYFISSFCHEGLKTREGSAQPVDRPDDLKRSSFSLHLMPSISRNEPHPNRCPPLHWDRSTSLTLTRAVGHHPAIQQICQWL